MRHLRRISVLIIVGLLWVVIHCSSETVTTFHVDCYNGINSIEYGNKIIPFKTIQFAVDSIPDITNRKETFIINIGEGVCSEYVVIEGKSCKITIQGTTDNGGKNLKERERDAYY